MRIRSRDPVHLFGPKSKIRYLFDPGSGTENLGSRVNIPDPQQWVLSKKFSNNYFFEQMTKVMGASFAEGQAANILASRQEE